MCYLLMMYHTSALMKLKVRTLNHLVAISIDSYARQILISSCMCQSFNYVTQPHIFM